MGKHNTHKIKKEQIKKMLWALGAPFFFALYPIVTLFSINASELAWREVVRSVLVSLFLGGIVFGIILAFFHNKKKASIWSSLFLLFFYSFGDLTDFIQEQFGLGFARADFGVFVVAAILLIWFFFILRKEERQINTWHLSVTLLGFFFFLQAAYSLGKRGHAAGAFFSSSKQEKPIIVKNVEDTLPDIYYIVLDGYGRADILEKYYEVDNTDFLKDLTDLGFYVAEESNSNYIQTLLSVGSTLNMDYLLALDINGKKLQNRHDLINIIQHNEVRRILSEKGYGTISFKNQYKATIPDATIFYDDTSQNLISPLSHFESVVLEHSLLRILYHWDAARAVLGEMPYKVHRDQILSTFVHLKEVPSLEGHYFVYAHIISPHPPFIFDENGTFRPRREAFSLADANSYIKTHSQKDYLVGYGKQIQYINTLVLETTKEILSRSSTPPIIIIQGDHGPGAFLNWGALERTTPEERFGILNAYYLPQTNEDMLYSSISPVNSFRVVLNLLFEKEYPLLDDIHYYSKLSTPLLPTEVSLE